MNKDDYEHNIKDYEFNAAKDFNRMLKKCDKDYLVESLRDIAFEGICIKCGSVTDERCYCDRDE